VSFKALVSLFILCLDDLSMAESGVLRSPTINVFIINISLYFGMANRHMKKFRYH